MRQRYVDLTLEVCEQAVSECFKQKWKRADILSFIEKYAGINRCEILLEDLNKDGDRPLREEVKHSVGLYLYGVLADLLEGKEPADILPVKIHKRPDDMTGKIRDIAQLCILHQLIGHAEFLMIEPMLKAKILPSQHASIPGRGQSNLRNQVKGYLRRFPEAKYIAKTDIKQAYKSVKYSAVINLIRQEIPNAENQLTILKYLAKMAPDGHLIIGGYLDAWLFNYSVSYALRYVLSLHYERRGKRIPYVTKVVTYMDDFAFIATNEKYLKRAIRSLDIYLQNNLNVTLKRTAGVTALLSLDEEKKRKNLPGHAARGCPNLDMAGFRFYRSHITMRKRVFLRSRRQWIRALSEYEKTGRLSLHRSRQIISRNSHISQTDSNYVRKKYKTDVLLSAAKKRIKCHDLQKQAQREEILNEMYRIREYLFPTQSNH